MHWQVAQRIVDTEQWVVDDTSLKKIEVSL
jgi:hypothetical protein